MDDEDLALMALGESAATGDREHVATCARCRGVLDQYSATVVAARSITEADRPAEPPAYVWREVIDELGIGSSTDAAAADASATVIPITSTRNRRSPWLIAVAAGVVGVALGAVVTSGILSPAAKDELVASAALAPIADSGLSGSATVARRDDAAVLTVSVPGLPAATDAYYEVWMATPDTATMVAIGTLNPGPDGTTFTLPEGMDVSSFPVVDVSVERFDGDAGHSATSVVRGSLTG